MAQYLRPYEGIDQFEGVLDGFHLNAPKLDAQSSGDSLELFKSDFDKFESDLVFDLAAAQYANQLADGLRATGLDLNQVDLFVRLRSPLLKKTLLIFHETLDEVKLAFPPVKIFPNQTINIVAEAPVIVQFGLFLNADSKVNFPRPYRKGTWLELREITIRSQRLAFSGFDWLPLTLDMRKEKRLPEKSLLHVEHHIPLFQAESLQEAVEVYVDDEYLHAMSAHQDPKIQTFLQHSLTAQVVSSLLINGLQNEIDGSAELPAWEDNDPTKLGAILVSQLAEQKMSDGSRMSVQERWDLLIKQPVDCVELIEDFFGVNVPAKKLLQFEGWSE